MKREQDPAHLAFIRTLECVLCGDDTSVEAAHISYRDPSIGKIGRGLGAKEHDKFTLPLCGKHHRDQTGVGNEREWWAPRDPVKLALAIYSVKGNYQEATRIIRAAR
jgi:hypothetical protein